ncbi:MAG: hypothetical protein JNM56_32900 [Planctomycetia bacterium]|nr:hypothetical protein [Planctomycetia bacterium]
MTSDRPTEPRPGSRLKKVGGYMVGLCLACLVIGRAIVRMAFPEMIGQGLTPTTLSILIPIWSLGIIGVLLWLAGWLRSLIG